MLSAGLKHCLSDGYSREAALGRTADALTRQTTAYLNLPLKFLSRLNDRLHSRLCVL